EGLAGNAVAGLLAMLLPVALALAVRPLAADQPDKTAGRLPPVVARLVYPAPLAAAVMSALIALGLAGTLSRGAWLAAGGAVLGLLAWRWPRAAPLIGGVGLLAALGAGAALLLSRWPLITALLAGASVESQHDTALFRLVLWDRAVRMIADHPFTGVGLNNFPLVQRQLYPIFPTQPEALVIHAHNVYLQAALDFGVPGLLALGAIGLAIARQCAPGLRRIPSATPSPAAVVLAGYCASLLVYALHGLTDALAVGSRPAVLAWLLGGLALGSAPAAVERGRLPPAVATLVWATSALLLGTALMFTFG
ncbi:MAG TPA: O-antigen ligase family protein, partial [Chloroflexia bacterium]|nr:O-antigen ligase family protein [Chloroflexia bacterium]